MSINTRLVSLTAAAILALTGTVAGVSTASASPAPQLAHILWRGAATPTVNGLRIRSGPGTEHTTYGLLYRGDHLKLIGMRGTSEAGDWFHVRLTRRSASGLRSGFSGWVYANYLRRTKT